MPSDNPPSNKTAPIIYYDTFETKNPSWCCIFEKFSEDKENLIFFSSSMCFIISKDILVKEFKIGCVEIGGAYKLTFHHCGFNQPILKNFEKIEKENIEI